MVATTDVDEATKDVDFAIMVGGFPRKGGMERKDVMAKNVSIYKSQASSLEKNAKRDVKVLTCVPNNAFVDTGSSRGSKLCCEHPWVCAVRQTEQAFFCRSVARSR